MNDKDLEKLYDRYRRASNEVGNVFQVLVDENKRLEGAERRRSEAFDNLTKGDGETMAVTADERNLIEGMRSGRYVMLGGVPRTAKTPPIDDVLRSLEGMLGLRRKSDCDCPDCVAWREAEAIAGIKAH